MGTAYETDIVAWACEQAELLRSGNFSAIDVDHIADEIDDVGRSEPPPAHGPSSKCSTTISGPIDKV
jgi:hypothetical protein